MKLSPPVVSIYLMADTDTADLAEAAAGAGAGLFEIGIPYSDPLADGPTVQRAGQRSLRGGMTTARALQVLRDIRARVEVPLVPMTYAAPVMAYGDDRFCADAAAAGASGLIVPDVPADEAGELAGGCREHGLDLVPLLAPTSSDDRIALACAQAGGFVYLVSVAGVTGTRERLSGRVTDLARRVRAHTDLPLLVGFGISAPEHAVAALEAGADGVVIGSKAIEVSEAGGREALAEFVASMVAAVNPATSASVPGNGDAREA